MYFFSFPMRSGDWIEIEMSKYGNMNFYTKATGWNQLYPQKNEDFEVKKWGRHEKIAKEHRCLKSM